MGKPFPSAMLHLSCAFVPETAWGEKSGRSSPEFEGALHIWPSRDRWHGCAVRWEICLPTEAL